MAPVLIAPWKLTDPSQCGCRPDCLLRRHLPSLSLLLSLFTLAHAIVSSRICQRRVRKGLKLSLAEHHPGLCVGTWEEWVEEQVGLWPLPHLSCVGCCENCCLQWMWRMFLGQLCCQSLSLHVCSRLCPREGTWSCWMCPATYGWRLAFQPHAWCDRSLCLYMSSPIKAAQSGNS